MKQSRPISIFFILFIYLSACQTTAPNTDAWANFLKCPDNSNCIKEVLAVKDAFLKNPQQVLTEFQATYEQGDDRVIGWLFLLRDSVLINPKMGTIQERLAMQQALIAAAKPFEKDAKVHEMAKSVMDELGIVDVAAGKINDPMATDMDAMTTTYCYQLNQEGEHTACKLEVNEAGEFSGYYNWYIEEKDGTRGIVKGENFKNDTLFMTHQYYQEGNMTTEALIFLKKGDKLTQLVSEVFDKEGRMVLKDKKSLKAGNTLLKVACATINKDIQPIEDMEQDMAFKYPYTSLTPKQEAVIANLQGEWQSLDDSQASIKLLDGQFWQMHNSQTPNPPLRYRYFPICPKDCNPAAKMPCLMVIGQDDICYSIVKADGKALSISQIGGTGNTNRYVKKK